VNKPLKMTLLLGTTVRTSITLNCVKGTEIRVTKAISGLSTFTSYMNNCLNGTSLTVMTSINSIICFLHHLSDKIAQYKYITHILSFFAISELTPSELCMPQIQFRFVAILITEILP
jgi:hypothetical protein